MCYENYISLYTGKIVGTGWMTNKWWLFLFLSSRVCVCECARIHIYTVVKIRIYIPLYIYRYDIQRHIHTCKFIVYQWSVNSSVKSQVVNSLAFEDDPVSTASTQLCYCSAKATINRIYTKKAWLCSSKTLFTKVGGDLIWMVLCKPQHRQYVL